MAERDHETAYRRRAAMSAEPHIVIIGGGGAAVAIELLRLAPNGVRVTLEPRRPRAGGLPLRSRRTGLTFRPLACSWPATKRAPSIGTAISLPLPSMWRCARTVPSPSARPVWSHVAQRLPTPRRPAADGCHLRDRALAFHQGR